MQRPSWLVHLWLLPFLVVGIVGSAVTIRSRPPRLARLLGRPGVEISASLAGIAACLLWRLDRRRLRDAEREAVESERVGRETLRRAVSLQSQVELLSAMREVSRIIRNDLGVGEILAEVCKIVEDLLGAETITLFLPEEGGAIRPGVHRSGGAAAAVERIDDENVEAVRLHRTLLRQVDRTSLTITVPLLAGQDLLGILRVELPLVGGPLEREERAEGYEMVLRDIAKHVALAIRTPTLQAQAVQDPLTGLFTKRHFLRQIREQHELAGRFGSPLSLILIDVDHFKSINDSRGHPTGDRVLAGVGEILRKSLRGSDTAYRYGGEELAVLMPSTPRSIALQVAERIRSRLMRHPFTDDDGKRFRITASFGVAATASSVEDPDALVRAADTALYAAKEGGRNRVLADDGSSPETKAPSPAEST